MCVQSYLFVGALNSKGLLRHRSCTYHPMWHCKAQTPQMLHTPHTTPPYMPPQRTEEDEHMLRVLHHAFQCLRLLMLEHLEAEELGVLPLIRVHATAQVGGGLVWARGYLVGAEQWC